MFNRFDIVQIITTKRIKFLSGPSGRAADPHGNWSIAFFSGNEAVITKNSTVVKIPVDDLRRVGSYDIKNFLKVLKASRHTTNGIELVPLVAKQFELGEAAARAALLAYNLPLKVFSIEEQQRALHLLKELKEKNND